MSTYIVARECYAREIGNEGDAVGDREKEYGKGGMTVRVGIFGVLLLGLLASAFASAAAAAPPVHPREKLNDLEGFNDACGVATDSDGNLYVSSAGEKETHVFHPVLSF